MGMLDTDRIMAASRGTPAQAIAILNGPDDVDRQFIDALYRWAKVAGVDAAVAVAQAYHETANLTSVRWLNDRNPAGIGIPADNTPQPFSVPDGDAAARLQIQCLYSLVEKRLHPDVPLWPAAERWMHDVWLDLHVLDPNCPAVRTVGDLNQRYQDRTGDMQATWAWDAAYHALLVAKGNAIFPNLTVKKETSMILPPAPPLEFAITPVGNVNRPDLPMPSPSFITVHEVGNLSPGANEDMHRNFVHNGGGEAQVSFHFVVGPTKAIQLFELDQVTWHASDGFNGTGNRDSVAIETIQIGDFDRTLWHLAWLISEILANPSRFVANSARAWDFSPARIVQHNHWAPDNKNCPQFIRDRGLWPTLMQRVDAWLGLEGAVRPPLPLPRVPEWMTDAELVKGIDRKLGKTTAHAFRRVWTAVRDTPRLQHAGKNAPEIGPPIKAGESFVGEFVYRSNGQWWVLTRWGTRVRVADLDLQFELKAA